jgi:N utilization substance protein A
VVVNEDQLSLAIGKRGQNVRLAARLTGWDVDILTPAEFQEGVKRLEATLRSIEGVASETVDKFIALGLIDVRDIEEVGTGPLMEELTLTEEMAQKVVERCSAEAKIVEVEKAAKKIADAAAKAAGMTESKRAMEALLGLGHASATGEVAATAEGDGSAAPGLLIDELTSAGSTGGVMPDAMQTVDGAAPEIVVHDERAVGNSADLSPEEQAIQGLSDTPSADAEQKEYPDEDSDVPALAEGRLAPPADGGDKP